MAVSNKLSAFLLLLGLILLDLAEETVCILCRTKTSTSGLAHRNNIQCANSCCGPSDDEYCCVVSTSVILGCAVGGGFMVVITIGVICYFLSRGRHCASWGSHSEGSISDSEPLPSRHSRRVSSVGSGLPQIDRLFLECSVRRPSQLSQASLPSRIYQIPEPQTPATSAVNALAIATVPKVYGGDNIH
ncbi:uncharacterized protein LOC124270215 [Haliotis rubra]|uniref:uncharacterized protein LOC124270215 n=1 Tax=Haliotis rubra TaxID=36100 RepID=UPI001EE5A9F6|nr:uncharacterized protein LOC124270215 [Haliotis rubra]